MGRFSGRLLALNLNRSEQKKLIVKHISFQRGQNEESEFVRRSWADCSLCHRLGQCSGCTLTQCTMYEQLLQKLSLECLKSHINLSTVLEAEHLE